MSQVAALVPSALQVAFLSGTSAVSIQHHLLQEVSATTLPSPYIAARVIHQQNDEVDVGDAFARLLLPCVRRRHFLQRPDQTIYPVVHASVTSVPVETARRPRLTMRTLMFEEARETANDSHELEGVAEGTYCVWTPPCKRQAPCPSAGRFEIFCLGESQRW
ncbi:hypothetical protein JHK85_012038 [Glycine max]|nr:hypothetical protein JHK85_012038 [Glycine max]KAG5056709.1 hypothetical protein JHK86_011705 [Glycine max]